MIKITEEKFLKNNIQEWNLYLAELFSKLNIEKVQLTSIGNSIASGYSAIKTIKPLLLRNDSIEKIMGLFDIQCSRDHFARAQNNNDEHIFNWIISDIKLSEIHRMNQNDYGTGSSSMVSKEMSEDLLNYYYPIHMEQDKGLNRLIRESNPKLANIIIYNGLTGSFIDGFKRNGTIFQKTMSGVQRDLVSIEATLKYIQEMNRSYNSNTQLYLCGIPNYFGIHISEVFNSKLKKIATQYANVSYVEPAPAKFFYKTSNENSENQNSVIKNIKSYQVDIHYDEVEYLQFMSNILRTIHKNYISNQIMISLDREFVQLNSQLEFEQISSNVDMVDKMMNFALQSQFGNLKDELLKKELLKKIEQYLLNRSPYDFYYIGKQHIKNITKKKD